jgi:hypothetical protein
MSTATAFQGEVMLAGWSETHNGGAKLTFWLPDAGELDAFRSLTVRKGNTAGQRFMAVLVQIGDDELPVQAEAPVAPAKPATGPLCLLAARLCQNPAFRSWLASHHAVTSASSEAGAAEFIRSVCEVNSRKELDTDARAAAVFHEHIRIPFSKSPESRQ